MPGKELITESCVRRMAPGSELVLGPQRIATPAALDLAFERGIRVVREGSAGGAGAGAKARSPLWERMKSTAGTFVVVVRDGRAVVTRLSERGPVTFGEE